MVVTARGPADHHRARRSTWLEVLGSIFELLALFGGQHRRAGGGPGRSPRVRSGSLPTTRCASAARELALHGQGRHACAGLRDDVLRPAAGLRPPAAPDPPDRRRRPDARIPARSLRPRGARPHGVGKAAGGGGRPRDVRGVRNGSRSEIKPVTSGRTFLRASAGRRKASPPGTSSRRLRSRAPTSNPRPSSNIYRALRTVNPSP